MVGRCSSPGTSRSFVRSSVQLQYFVGADNELFGRLYTPVRSDRPTGLRELNRRTHCCSFASGGLAVSPPTDRARDLDADRKHVYRAAEKSLSGSDRRCKSVVLWHFVKVFELGTY